MLSDLISLVTSMLMIIAKFVEGDWMEVIIWSCVAFYSAMNALERHLVATTAKYDEVEKKG